MNPRRVVIGCVSAAVIAIALAVVTAIVAWRQISAPVPLLSARALADAGTVGFAVLRLDPDDPWIQGLFQELDKHSIGQGEDPREVLPAEVAWSAWSPAPPGPEGHLVMAGISPRGRFLGMVADFSLWKLGRSGAPRIAREVYNGEGITSFPGRSFPGFLFVRGNQMAWASDLATAHLGVDRMVKPPAESDAAAAPILSLLGPPAKGLLSGAILNPHGEIARVLTRLPGTALDLQEAEVAPATSLRFSFSTSSADTGEGEVVIQFAAGTPAETIDRTGALLAERLGAATPSGTTLAVQRSNPAPDTALLEVRVSGLRAMQARFLSEGIRAIRQFQASAREGGGSPDQSSSTFQ